MGALLRGVVGLAVVTAAMLLAADARSAHYSAADMTVAAGSLAAGDALAETSLDTEVRAVAPRGPAKAPCPFCPKRTKTKLCSTPPCPPAIAFGGPAPIAFANVGSAYCLDEDSRRVGIDWRPDPPPPKT